MKRLLALFICVSLLLSCAGEPAPFIPNYRHEQNQGGKTPSSGGSALVVTTAGTTTLKTGITVGSETIWSGMGATSATGGTEASITTYNSGSSW